MPAPHQLLKRETKIEININLIFKILFALLNEIIWGTKDSIKLEMSKAMESRTGYSRGNPAQGSKCSSLG